MRSWLITLALLMTQPASASTPADEVRTARSLAAQCRYAEAGARIDKLLERSALPGDVVLIARQDAATFANERLDYAEAARHARAALDLATSRYGSDSPQWAQIAQNLAVAWAGLGRADDVAALYARILPALDPARFAAARLAALLAAADFDQARGHASSARGLYADAEALARRADLPVGLQQTSWIRIADAHRRALSLDEARVAIDQADRLAAGAIIPRITLVRSGIAMEAGKLRAALDLAEPLAGIAATRCDPVLTVDIAQRLGTIHMLRREVPEAQAAFERAAVTLAPLGLADAGRQRDVLYGLAVTARFSRDFTRSAALFDRAVAASEAMAGDRSAAVAQVLIEKALMLSEAKQDARALATAREGLAMVQSATDMAPLARAYAHATLGLVAKAAHDYPTAKNELAVALGAFSDARDASFDLTPGLSALGEIALDEGRLDEAGALFARTLAIQRAAGGDASLALGMTYSRLAQLEEAKGNRAVALAQSQRAVDVLLRRFAIGEALPWSDALVERRAARALLVEHLRLLTAASRSGALIRDPAVLSAALPTMQAANTTRTGAAIALMASRLGQSDARTAGKLRERSDLMLEWRGLQDDVIGTLDHRWSARSEARERDRATRQQVIATRIGTIDRELFREDPRLELLIKSGIVGLDDLTRRLRPSEAMVTIIIGDAETYVLLVTPHDAALFRTELSEALARQLAERLRRGMNPQLWTDGPPPFDAASAYQLYQLLFAPLEPLLQGITTLLLVSDAPLSSLPLHVLLTSPPPRPPVTPEDYAALPWLIKQFALADFPCVAAIVQIDAIERRGRSRSTMLGVGDPSFRRHAVATSVRADPAAIGALAPLPDSRRELREMATAFGDRSTTLLLGNQASEGRIRGMDLSGFALIAFATHGLVAGQMIGYAEPALVLTTPRRPNAADDGLLSATEIAQLRLDSDWVILSACNTAAADGTGEAEPLSGMAKAFFYAGARALLVSHWPVETRAAADLVSTAVRESLSTGSRAEGLRRSMLRMATDASSIRTHPLFWAPFALVGR